MHSLVKLLKRLVLVCLIVVAAGVNLRMVLGMQQRFDAMVSIHEQLQRSGIGQVTSLRGIPQVCGKTNFFFGDMYYIYAVDVARIPDPFWDSRAAQWVWYRGPVDDSEFYLWKFKILPDDMQGCPETPDMNSSRFIFTLVPKPSSATDPHSPSFVDELNVMAYDTETSRLYWVYQRFSGFP